MKALQKYTIRELDIMFASLEKGNPMKKEVQDELDRRLSVLDVLTAKKDAQS